jgi:hypothetical protein
MDAVQDILSGIDIDQLAQLLGTDPATAQSAAATAIPTLLGSLQANASTPEGAQSLATALGQHADSPATGVDLSQIDLDDGRKIVAHTVAGDTSRLAGVSGLGGDLLAKLLPILAPIVLNYLAQKFLGGGNQVADAAPASSGLGDLLGGLLGGGTAGSAGSSDMLGELLGGLLGGGGPQQAPAQQEHGMDLGGLLGQILGR